MGAITAEVERGEMRRTYHLEFGQRGKKIRLDGKPVRASKEYFGNLNVILFAPEDLLVVRGSPTERRRFVDRATFGYSPNHLDIMQRFERILRGRNAFLKRCEGRLTSENNTQLQVYDEQLAAAGTAVRASRLNFIEKIQEGLSENYRSISGGKGRVQTTCLYSSEHESFTEAPQSKEEALAALSSRRSLDLRRGHTTLGAHRDDILFTLDGHDASTFASQGQLRTLILGWKIAELALLHSANGDAPILLLDDVSSELDSNRNEFLFDFLGQSPCQCFITTTHKSHVLVSRERVDFAVQDGRIEAGPTLT